MSKKRVLITGANGFIGQHLMHDLFEKGCYELATINRSKRVNTLDTLNNSTIEFIGDIADYEFVNRSMRDFSPHIIFHLAGYKDRNIDLEKIDHFVSTNLIGNINLFRAALQVDTIESIIALGTTDEYGSGEDPYIESQGANPLSPYGFSKLLGTQAAVFFGSMGLPISVLRPTLIYGPGQGNDMFIPSLISSLSRDKIYLMTKGEQRRDFLYVTDLVDVMINLSSANPGYGEIYNVGYGQSIMIKDVAVQVVKYLKKEHLLKIGAIDYRADERFNYSVSIAKLKQKIVGFTPRDFSHGIERTIELFFK